MSCFLPTQNVFVQDLERLFHSLEQLVPLLVLKHLLSEQLKLSFKLGLHFDLLWLVLVLELQVLIQILHLTYFHLF